MRRRITIGLGLIGSLGVLVLLLTEADTSSQAANAKDAPVFKTEDVNTAHEKSTPHHRPKKPELAIEIASLAQSPSRSVKLASGERRAGENDQNYDLRTKFYAKYAKLIRQAKLTPKQVPLVLSRFADAQEQSELAWAAFDESATTPPFDPISLSVMDDTLSRDFATSLREVLSHEQMVRFVHISIIGSPLNFGIYRPLEIQRESPL